MILLIDNYDSFVYNLARYVRQLGEDTLVIRNDELTKDQVLALDFKAIILSPGTGRPKQAGISVELIQQLTGKIPILGICLGHQAIAQAFGAKCPNAWKSLRDNAFWRFYFRLNSIASHRRTLPLFSCRSHDPPKAV